MSAQTTHQIDPITVAQTTLSLVCAITVTDFIRKGITHASTEDPVQSLMINAFIIVILIIIIGFIIKNLSIVKNASEHCCGGKSLSERCCGVPNSTFNQLTSEHCCAEHMNVNPYIHRSRKSRSCLNGVAEFGRDGLQISGCPIDTSGIQTVNK
jgi:hypothetical protein